MTKKRCANCGHLRHAHPMMGGVPGRPFDRTCSLCSCKNWKAQRLTVVTEDQIRASLERDAKDDEYMARIGAALNEADSLERVV